MTIPDDNPELLAIVGKLQKDLQAIGVPIGKYWFEVYEWRGKRAKLIATAVSAIREAMERQGLVPEGEILNAYTVQVWLGKKVWNLVKKKG